MNHWHASRTAALVLFLVLSISCAPSCRALSLYSGGCSFNVDVMNRHFQSIRNARGYAWVSGDSARIDVSAPGYRSASTYVRLSDDQTYYNVRVTLSDPTVFFHVKNASGAVLPGAWAAENNVGVWGDEYRFEVSVPAEGYSNFVSTDVQVECSGGFVFGERVTVYELGSYRRIEVTVNRRCMTEYSNVFTIVVPSDEELADGYRRQLARKIRFGLEHELGRDEEGIRSSFEKRLKALERLLRRPGR